jgi:small-conductance mechanosensitive channel
MPSEYSDLLSNVFVRLLLILIATVIVHLVVRVSIEHTVRRLVFRERYENKIDEKKREDTLIGILRTGAAVLIWMIGVLLILDALGANLAALAAGAGLFGIIIGMGAQSTIRDILAGIFILFENQYRVGDIITVSGGTTGIGTSGVVEDITLRITKLRDLDGTLNIVRNGEASVITNRTFKYSSVVVDVTVTYESDIDKVEELMNKVGLKVAGDEKWKSLTIEPIQFLRIDAFNESGAVARAVGKVAPASQWDVAGAYRRELLDALSKGSVQVGLPQVVVHNFKKLSQ